MLKKQALIFDFDGVIADTFEFHRKHFKKYLGIDLSKEEYQNLHKGNVFDGEKLSENEKTISDGLVDYFQKIVKDHYQVKSFDGINAVLKKLNENYLLFVITSSSEVNIINFLKKERTLEFFTKILGVEAGKLKTEKLNLILGKYNLEKENVLLVTDTSGDVSEAKKVHIGSIAVTWGFHSKKILTESSPKFYAKKPEEILEIAKKFFSLED